MIKKITNKSPKFYQYMGKFFGSRIIEKQTNDRIYDDPGKEWYIYVKNEKVLAFVSIHNDIIKNIYTTKEEYLEELLKAVKKETKIKISVVTNIYDELYEKCGFIVDRSNNFKNFVAIYTQDSDEEKEKSLEENLKEKINKDEKNKEESKLALE